MGLLQSRLNRDPIENYHKNDVKNMLNGLVVIFLHVTGVAYPKWYKYQISMPNRDLIRNYRKNDV